MLTAVVHPQSNSTSPGGGLPIDYDTPEESEESPRSSPARGMSLPHGPFHEPRESPVQLGTSYEKAFLQSRVEAALNTDQPGSPNPRLSPTPAHPVTPVTAAYQSANRDVNESVVSPDSMEAEERRMEVARTKAAEQVKESMRTLAALEEDKRMKAIQEAPGNKPSPPLAAGGDCDVCSACSLQ